MRYWKITVSTNFCGTECEHFFTAESEEDLHQDAAELARENAESYSYLETGWNEGFEDEEAENEWMNENSNWEIIEITKEEYDKNT